MGGGVVESRVAAGFRRTTGVVGRSRQLAELSARASLARAGCGQVALVEGDSGFGKTALVHAFLGLDEGLGDGWIVATALADGTAWAAPHGVAEQIVDDLAYADDISILRTGLWDKGIRGIAEQILAAIDVAGVPVCIVVDDAQWVDEDSAGVLMLVAQAARHRPILVIVAARPGRSALLNRVRRIAEDDTRGAVVAVSALQPAEVRELVAAALDIDYPMRSAAVLADYTRGCPLDILAAIEALGADPARADQLVRHVPDLVDSIRAVLSQVTDACRCGVEVMAVLDAPTPVRKLDAVASHLGRPVDVSAALQVDLIELENVEGVLTVRPPHARVRDAVLALMDADSIRAIHAAVAEVVTGHRGLAHRAASCAGGDEEFAGYLERKASEVRTFGDLDRAVGYGLWSIRLSTDTAAQRRRLLACAVDAVEGRHLRAFDGLVDQIEALPPEPERDLLLGYAQLRRGDTAAALACCSGALAADFGDAAEPTALRVVVTCELATSVAAMGDMTELATLCDRLERDLDTLAADQSLAPDLVGRQIELSALRSAVAHYTKGIAVHLSPIAQLLADSPPARYGSRHAVAFITRGTLLHKDGQLRAALEDLVSGLALVDDDASWVAQQGRIELTMVQFRLGDWPAAERTAAEALDIALDHGDPWSTAPAYAVAALVPLGRGELALAERRLGLAQTSSTQAGTLLAYRTIALAEVLIAVTTHCPERALNAMRQHHVHDDVGDRVGNWDAAESAALLPLGRLNEALAILGPCARATPEHRLVRAGVAFASGDRVSGAREMRRALEALTDDSSVIIRGVTWLQVGRFLASDGEPELGETLILRAHDLYERLGAVLWLAECDEALAKVQRSSAACVETSVPACRDARLTPREQEIARLVGTGFTNREVAEQLTVSIRTVDFHLRNVLHKLGLSSRRQLRGLAP